MFLGSGIEVAIVARMNSGRLPGKCLIPLDGLECSLSCVLESASLLVHSSNIHVLTTSDSSDDPISMFCRSRNINCYRGHPTYVLDRLHDYFIKRENHTIIYWGADCPLMDENIFRKAYKIYSEENLDYISNYNPCTFPEGFDVNIIRKECLVGCYVGAATPSQRINPFLYALLNLDKWKVGNIEHHENLSNHHWSLDFAADLEFVSAIIQSLRFYGMRPSIENIMHILGKNEQLKALDLALQKPIQENGFLNSPNIIREIRADIDFLRSKKLNTDEKSSEAIDLEISKLQTLLGD